MRFPRLAACAVTLSMCLVLLLGFALSPTATGQFQPTQVPGTPFSGYISNAAPSTGSESATRFALVDINGKALTVGASDQVVVTDGQFYCASALIFYMYDGADNTASAGEIFFVGRSTTTVSSGSVNLQTPHYCSAGTYPKVKGSVDSAVEAVIHGFIVRR
jgi:hypothetical protein